VITSTQIDQAKQKIVNKILADISLSEIVVLIIEKANVNAEEILKNMSEQEILDMIRGDTAQKPRPRKPKATKGPTGGSTIRSSIKKSKTKEEREQEPSEPPPVLTRVGEYLKNLLKPKQKNKSTSKRKKKKN
tara:strand:- start:477 stop:875 length:399 start_codon:yes stop_codon:yes gene_type:complete